MKRQLWVRIVTVFALGATPIFGPVGSPVGVQAAGTSGTVRLDVVSALTRGVELPFRDFPVTAGAWPTGADFHWQINEDSVGDVTFDPARCLPATAVDSNTPTAGSAYPGPGGEQYPALCTWPSVRAIDGHSRVVTNGDAADFPSAGLNLPNGKYLISVTAGGFKIDGAHFTVNGDTQTVTVRMNPLPLPNVTVRVRVFNDNASTNGQYDGVPESYVPANGPGDPGPDAPERNNMEGFIAHLNDIAGEVAFDVYGNPLCTEYQLDTNGRTIFDGSGAPLPVVYANDGASGGHLAGTGSNCISDRNGDIVIPNVGPNRYAVTVAPPDPQTATEPQWFQTTTLEGGHDWDTWNMEGANGFDTELVVGGESTPFVFFGYVQEQRSPALQGPGSIKGQVMVGRTYVAQTGGLPNPGTIWGGGTGTVNERPVEDALVALACISGACGVNQDQEVYMGRADANGRFNITNLPTGTYTVTIWDEAQVRLLDFVQVTVQGPTPVDIGAFPLAGWFTELDGSVFLDSNGNGRRDAGESGVPDFGLTLRTRVNTLNDQGAASALTGPDGEWSMEAYPLGQFLILEAYHPAYRTTGATWKLDNEPTGHTYLTSQVDWNVLNIFGLAGHFDIGVQPYAIGENGGIVGTVSYDVTRNELNPRNAATEDWQPGVPGVTMHTWRPGYVDGSGVVHVGAKNPANRRYDAASSGALRQFGITSGGQPCARPLGEYGTSTISTCLPWPTDSGDPSAPGVYTTESWSRPTGCTGRAADGTPAYSKVLPQSLNGVGAPASSNMACLEAPMMSVQFGENGEVDGNFGFGTDQTGDYLVEAVPPLESDEVAALNGRASDPRPLYKFTDEAAINVFTGDSYVTQNGWNYDSSIADPATPLPSSGYPENTSESACAGKLHTITANPDFADNGGSPWEGQQRPYCDVKLVRVQPRRSIAPIFHVYTDVPIPTRFVGYIIDDLNVSTDPKSTVYGEKAGMSNVPIGIYDYTGRLVHTSESDYNGYYEALLPSTDTIACPTPSGVCPNVYRLVGNDPGQLGRPNRNYNPQYRTIGTEFQGWAGVVHPVDQAPSRVAASFQLPGSQGTYPPECAVPTTQPEFYAINRPYGPPDSSAAGATYTITGRNFGATAGRLLLGSFSIPTLTWSDTQITFKMPTGATPGPQTLRVMGANNKKATNGVTFHVIYGSYQPTVIEVKDLPGADTATAFDPDNDPLDGSGPRAIQRALDRARAVRWSGPAGARRDAVVVVYPNLSTRPEYNAFNPDRAYFENLIVHSNVKLQGVGPGGPGVAGSRVDGRYFWGATAGAGGGEVTPYFDSWETLIAALPSPAQPAAPLVDGEVMYVRPETTTQFGTTFTAAIDGFTITGGDQQGFPTNLNFLGGGTNGTPRTNIATQGGGVMLDTWANNTQISNNVFVSNGGTMGGAIRVGSPELGTTPATSSNHNSNVKILRNRIVANGGTMFAGAIGLFYGADGYEVADNDICGNASAEYGGGISHYGRSPGGRIHHNRIYLNQSYDEAGGVMIAGELPADPSVLSDGAGAVTIDHNEVMLNLSNDDGGGIRFLMAAGPNNDPMDVNDNIIANNVATHEGGGIAIDDTPNVRITNNTIVKNITTATAMTSTGAPAPAGVAVGANSALLQRRLNALYGASAAPKFANPVILNDVFADNRAGTWTAYGVVGIGLPGDATAPLRWDVGASDGAGKPTVHGSFVDSLTTDARYAPGTGFTTGTSTNVAPAGSSIVSQVGFVSTYDTLVSVANWRTFPGFRPAAIVTLDRPVGTLADYHINPANQGANQVINKGLASLTAAQAAPYGVVAAPATDIDDAARTGLPDRGADEGGYTPPPAPPPLPPQAVPLLDDFNRANAVTLNGDGNDWTFRSAVFLQPSPFAINGNTAIPQYTGFAVWTAGGSLFGPAQQAQVTFTQMPAAAQNQSVSLLLKASGLGGGASTAPQRFVEVQYRPNASAVDAANAKLRVGYSTNGTGTTVFLPAPWANNLALTAGTDLRASVNAAGLVTVYVGATQVGTVQLPVGWTGNANTGNGQVGLRFSGSIPTNVANTTKVDNFRGGSL